jgi:hypothetical protein
MNSDQHVAALISGPMFSFSGGLHHTLPLAAHGVYTIWKDSQFLYVGIAGRKLDLSIVQKKMRGLKDRLDSHWKGRRSGDQFAVYVFDRFIVSSLTDDQRRQFETGELQGDILTRSFIQQQLSYRFLVTTSYKEAMTIEAHLRRGRTSAGFPVLNPKRDKAEGTIPS